MNTQNRIKDRNEKSRLGKQVRALSDLTPGPLDKRNEVSVKA